MRIIYTRHMEIKAIRAALAEIQEYCPEGHPMRFNAAGELDARLPCAACTRIQSPAHKTVVLTNAAKRLGHRIRIFNYSLAAMAFCMRSSESADEPIDVLIYQWELRP